MTDIDRFLASHVDDYLALLSGPESAIFAGAYRQAYAAAWRWDVDEQVAEIEAHRAGIEAGRRAMAHYHSDGQKDQ